MSENKQSPIEDLFIELTPEETETISGGYEVFTVRNKTKYNIPYFIDGKYFKHKAGSVGQVWTAYGGGRISFDVDSRSGHTKMKTYNLRDGEIYEFQYNTRTPGNPYDIELYKIS